MTEPNWTNKTLFQGNNLEFLRAMNSETVDLIATDPPFNKGKDFHATPESLAEGASFGDKWSWKNDVRQEWLDKLAVGYPQVLNFISWIRNSNGEDLAAFICFLSVRLIEMRRLLKCTGSIYLHCDPTASHYIKALMDTIFGRQYFRNEIVWCYNKWTNSASSFQKNHDIIFVYGKSENVTFNPQVTLSENQKAVIERGYHTNVVGGVRQLLVYDKEKAKNKIEENNYDRIVYRDSSSGTLMSDWWSEINFINSQAKERLGYPTQKPLKLYERIIKASSNVNDIVLDPFCGCGTTLLAAESLGRQWVGIDISEKACELVQKRFEEAGMSGSCVESTGQHSLGLTSEFSYETELPTRSDDKLTDNSNLMELKYATM